MLKDIVVNLTGGGPQDFAVDYAISVAKAFGAHVTGVAFVFDPVIPDAGLGGVSPSLIEMQRDENTKSRRRRGQPVRGGGQERRRLGRDPHARCQPRRRDRRVRAHRAALRHRDRSASRSATTAPPRN